MIKVCDAIMGTGKSSAAIRYMNEHSDSKFIYVTPYLEEAERIKRGCPNLQFIEPSDKLPGYHFRKCEHTAALIKSGRNITTTHQAFKRYTAEMLDGIRDQGYTLIVDENMTTLERYDIDSEDLQMLVDAGYVETDGESFRPSSRVYNGSLFKDFFGFLNLRELIQLRGDERTQLYYWVMPPKLLLSFRNVIIMTYLFKGQGLHHMLEMYNIGYEYIGIERMEDGGYRFGQYPGYTPEYVYHLNDMIHIIDNRKMNAIGDSPTALSMAWFDKESSDVKQLRNNISNCMTNIWRDIPADKKLWGSFNSEYNVMRGKGYTKSFLTFNARATNAYKDRTCLVYIANLFMNVAEKRFFVGHGVAVDEDMYALSIMVQWIWRSAIRDGNAIDIYIPSKRMRVILTDWMKRVGEEGNGFGK